MWAICNISFLKNLSQIPIRCSGKHLPHTQKGIGHHLRHEIWVNSVPKLFASTSFAQVFFFFFSLDPELKKTVPVYVTVKRERFRFIIEMIFNVIWRCHERFRISFMLVNWLIFLSCFDLFIYFYFFFWYGSN